MLYNISHHRFVISRYLWALLSCWKLQAITELASWILYNRCGSRLGSDRLKSECCLYLQIYGIVCSICHSLSLRYYFLRRHYFLYQLNEIVRALTEDFLITNWLENYIPFLLLLLSKLLPSVSQKLVMSCMIVKFRYNDHIKQKTRATH